MKKKLWKDIFKSIAKSKGRFVSIMGLMLLGSFALVGLKVTGPDMRATGEDYSAKLNVADVTVIGGLGIDKSDEALIDQAKGLEKVEYGYLKDVVIKDTDDSVRLFSASDNVSEYQLTKGRLPEKGNEIALSQMYDNKYKIGDQIDFTEKQDQTGSSTLKRHNFKVVGFVYSGEILSNVNLGQSTAGTGALKGYAVVSKNVFDVDYYMLARLTFDDTKGLDPYSTAYTDKIQEHKDDLAELLKDQPAQRLSSIKEEYQTQITDGQQRIDNAKQEITAAQLQLDEAKQQLDSNSDALQAKMQQANEQNIPLPAEASQQLSSAQAELALKEQEYEEKNQAFQKKKGEAEAEINQNEQRLTEAQETLEHLEEPEYSLNSRREIPGGEGYKIYSSLSTIVDALANVFPIFLYFVAALVTFTTMSRFVEEERTNTGTLKALGYDNRDVMKKFTFYGLVSSLTGTVLGVILGHTLLPLIVYNAYHSGFTVPKIEMHFHWQVTLVALLLALFSAVLPAWLVAVKELREKPAQLLLPKAPTAGSKILLERITFIWKRLSFTHKVTARNIFRYKKRMLMTIFGVAGAVALLFAGFSVQHSISGINERQFGDLIRYDMIVAENNYVTDDQQQEIDDLLNSSSIDKKEAVCYEEMSKVAGANQDKQSIKLIVPSNEEQFSDYIQLENRQTGKKIALPDNGVVISERLSKLLNVEKGDSIVLKDENDQKREMKVSGITEMYMGHFAFMSQEGYQKTFDQQPKDNAYLVRLKTSTVSNTEKQAAKFTNLSGVKGVVQNTTLTNQVDTIVHSLDKIMTVLIIIAALLGIVILYNLTNINVSERIRELSTIKVLGFYDKEVTLYIYRETILLTLMGILTGFGVGELLHRYIITVVPPDDVMFNPALSVTSFVIPAAIISLVTLMLGFVVNRRLRNVDMLEALKSVD
ncbi:FtsX-like permease family protein [Enterococcus hulanensis]|uniref:ABC transporter permease n=1 Tax=Enterococcus TaxID=1350 RepID=UPI000B5A3835|nr:MULTISPECIES: ABC transporter permease [Enterococcus]MBO0412891.1 FtsX-like permease family protein [Enterococcus hulanensis]OTO19964.1 hypothetical protein A5875_001313 [Enterococcus sp. 3H8_DIV0648]